MDVRCKYLKVERAPLSCEEGFVYPGDRTFCLKRIRSYWTFLNVKIVNFMKKNSLMDNECKYLKIEDVTPWHEDPSYKYYCTEKNKDLPLGFFNTINVSIMKRDLSLIEVGLFSKVLSYN